MTSVLRFDLGADRLFDWTVNEGQTEERSVSVRVYGGVRIKQDVRADVRLCV